MQIADAPIKKMVMLGNHDAWNCLTSKRLELPWSDDPRTGPGRSVMAQMDALGEAHLAWNCRHVEGRPLSIVGARPFSKVCCCQPDVRKLRA